jgi:hypothetical protein
LGACLDEGRHEQAVMQNFELTMDLGLAYELMASQQRRTGADKGVVTL